MKSSIDTLKAVGGTARYGLADSGNDVMCVWGNGNMSQVGYGASREEAATRVVEALEYFIFNEIRIVRAGRDD